MTCLSLGKNVYLRMSEILFPEPKISPCLICKILIICVFKQSTYYLFLNYKRKVATFNKSFRSST